MRAPEMRGEALSLVLDFAAQRFSRVAMFMVRDDIAVGMAHQGLDAAGGPDAEAFRGIEVPTRDVEWFRGVLDDRAARCSPPQGEGDRSLAAKLGSQEPAEAYVAPIESGGRVVALLYADRLPSVEPVGDTTILEIALHEAGLALERALLERALERASGRANV